MQAKLIKAEYSDDAESVILFLDNGDKKFTAQIHRNQIASFGARDKSEITRAMMQYVDQFNRIYRDRPIKVVSGENGEKRIG
jgi:hypothetical protein